MSPIRQLPSDQTQPLPSPDPGPLFFPDEAWAVIGRVLRFSDREQRIVQSVCADQEYEAIASSIGISVERVYRAVQRIYVRLRIGSKAELKFMLRAVCLAHAGASEAAAGTSRD
ncbi:MAG TPA: hypothetical protein VGL72_04950 [Bryobacteraceae bacterium]